MKTMNPAVYYSDTILRQKKFGIKKTGPPAKGSGSEIEILNKSKCRKNCLFGELLHFEPSVGFRGLAIMIVHYVFVI